MNISYDYYRVFYYVAKYRSITQAAAALMNNQPNLTRIIKNLEGELGCSLFVRSRQGVQLTPEGEQLFAHIRIAVEHIEAGEEELTLSRGLQQGTVSIGASGTALRCLLLPVLKKYRQLYPGIRIRVSNYSTPQALAALKNGLVDIAVATVSPAEISDSLTCRVLKNIQDVAVCGTAFSFPANRKLSLADLSRLPLISMGEHTKTYAFYASLFTEKGAVFSPSVEAATADQILPLVMHDLGIGFIPGALLGDTVRNGTVKLVPLADPIPLRTICLVKRAGLSLSAAARKLDELLTADDCAAPSYIGLSKNFSKTNLAVVETNDPW
ncbi:MAG: LysR family transcriptional regulator [Lachnospiraceae bacterium]|nr:LysR family transcriptional regulator [Lachnospiraceae bacterium]